MPGAYLMGTGRHRAFPVASFCPTVAGIASMAFLAPAWGLAGAIAGFAVGAVASAASVAVLAYLAKPLSRPAAACYGGLPEQSPA